MMKKILSVCLVLVMLMGVCVCMPSCSSPAPDIDLVYDRLVQCIEDAHEANVLLFGKGLPTYAREGEEEDLLHRYYGVADNGMECVSIYSKYAGFEQMKAVISAVYSEDYCESLFETLFTGYAVDVTMGTVLPARYAQDDSKMYQNTKVKPLVRGLRVYDYSQMEIVSPSNATYITVELPSYAEDRPGEWEMVDLHFIYENGNWYLDGPSC